MKRDDLVTGEATDGFESRSRGEEEAIRARRRVAGVDGEGPVIGLALSGGHSKHDPAHWWRGTLCLSL